MNATLTATYTQEVKNIAQQLGFDFCGISKAAFLEDDARRLEAWLQQNKHGHMQYMANHFDLRTDPRKLVPGTQSVITLLYNYYPEEIQPVDLPKISKYAYGNDYHDVIRKKLHEFLALMNEKIGKVEGRGFVDSAPVLERAWAQKSGLGWIGKNANLIHKNQGSFFFIATLMVDLVLEYDHPLQKDYCGTCTICIDACPTDAIISPAVVDGSKCISYYTIELKEALQHEVSEVNYDGWMFGCDVCQDVCPWNRFSQPHQEPEFAPKFPIMNFSIADWLALEEHTFKQIFGKSPLKRRKFDGIQSNVKKIAPKQ